jgi:YegS/Rv2252/BmrU family lipid kinase
VTRPIALLANPSAADGRSLKCVDLARAVLDERGAEYRVVTPAGRDAAVLEAQRAAARGETVAAVGGDGTIGLIAGALRGSGTPLAIVPAGRGNDFARVLGIPTDPREAIALALDGEERAVDVADVDGKPFVCIASFGFDSDANRIANEAKLVRGNLVYAYAALRALLGWKHANYRVTVDGEQHELRGWSAGVCNSKAYGGGMYVAPHAKLDDGKLDVVALTATSKWTMLTKTLPSAFKNNFLDNDAVRTFRGKVIEVQADRPFTIYADGDPIGELPATVRVSPGSLRVLVPRTS